MISVKFGYIMTKAMLMFFYKYLEKDWEIVIIKQSNYKLTQVFILYFIEETILLWVLSILSRLPL